MRVCAGEGRVTVGQRTSERREGGRGCVYTPLSCQISLSDQLRGNRQCERWSTL